MALTKPTYAVNIITNLATTSADRGLTADQFKAKFDETPAAIKTYLADVLTVEVDDLVSTIPKNLGGGAIINGNFDVWQRGTSFLANGSLQYGADRWQIYSANTTSITYSQQIPVLIGSQFSQRVQRTAANAATNGVFLVSNLETKDSLKLVGQKLTLSFWVKAGANYSAASGYLVADIISGTGTDESRITGFTGYATEATSNHILTTSWQKFTVTTANVVSSSKTQLAIGFTFTPAGTAGAADYYEIAQVKLEVGSVATTFIPKTFAEELRDCQRYYQLIGKGIVGGGGNTTVFSGATTYYTMRVAPTFTLTASNPAVADVPYSADFTAASSTINGDFGIRAAKYINIDGFTGLTTGKLYLFFSDYISLDAEL